MRAVQAGLRRFAGPAVRWLRLRLRYRVLRLWLPDAAALARLAAAPPAGQLRGLRVRLATVPDWQVAGLRPPRPDRWLASFRWRRRGGGLTVAFRWRRPREAAGALADAVAAVLRVRPWALTSGPVSATDLAAPEALVTVAANPYGRVLLGRATGYRLHPAVGLRDSTGRVVARIAAGDAPESAALQGRVTKYAVVSVAAATTLDSFPVATLRALAACGMVFAAPDPGVRDRLAALGLVTVADPASVDDLPGYRLSVAASRRMVIAADPLLRRTALAGAGAEGGLPLPGVSVVVASKRPEDLETCLRHLAGQDYPALEVVIGLHGYDVPEATRQRWAELLPCPVRAVPVPATEPFGAVLGRLCRLADGELVTKVDDDDHYGPHHVTDLVLARHTSGADLVAKGARFVHFPERGETIDRAWAAPEVFDVTPAGGTMLVGRGDLAEVGGWSHAPKHVDAELLARVRASGGLIYRTHALEYVYVRRAGGHTFVTELDELLSHAERVYPGLPDGLPGCDLG